MIRTNPDAGARATRLLRLLQLLRRTKTPVTGRNLADQAQTSLRTLYRDIQDLRRQGADIRGEAGTGFVMKPGFLLPPLMFSEDEIEALVLGSRWVAKHTDPVLGAAARDALAKIEAVLPPEARDLLEHSALVVGPPTSLPACGLDLAVVRQAIRDRRRVTIGYRDGRGQASERLVWPVALAFFEQVRIVAAWCETRQAFRHFRLDRMASWTPTTTRYPGSRASLLGRWKDTLDLDQD